MVKTDPALYSAFCAKDPRFDGRFFVGVSSTRIYCRPVCRARMPREENCTCFSSAAEAEHEGYRPCLICRPELAPGTARVDGFASLARRAAGLMEESCGSGASLTELAARLGCSDRHLRRVFEAEYHISPVQYLQTCRLLLAKSLLTDTALSVTEVALASGFGSLRRFHDAFKGKYHLTPTGLRKRLPKERRTCADIRMFLGYRPPYLWDDLLSFLEQRAIPGIERVQDGVYYRTVSIRDMRENLVQGWIAVADAPGKSRLEVTLGESLLPVLPQVLGRVKNMFDLSCDPEIICDTLSSMNVLRQGLFQKGTRLPGCFDPFEIAVRAILGQQVSVKAASILAGRVAAAFGEPVSTPVEGLTLTFPTAERMAALDGPVTGHLGPLGVIRSRSEAIQDLARAVTGGELSFDACCDPEAGWKRLRSIRGVGSWTASYIAMRAMAWPDAFLEDDAGIRRALPGRTPKELRAMAEAWRPWRSYAVMALWNELERRKRTS